MDKPSKEKLTKTFTRPQLRRLRQLPTRDPNAWLKLVRTSPPSLVVTARDAPKASTSTVTMHDNEDGLPVPSSKRSRHSQEPKKSSGSSTTRSRTGKFEIPRDESVDEAMSGFAFMNIDYSKPLQDKSNHMQGQQVYHEKTSLSASKQSEDNKANQMVGDPATTPIHGSRIIPSSTPPQNEALSNHDFASLEAANLSTIAQVPKFRFFGNSESHVTAPGASSETDFTFSRDALESSDATVKGRQASPSLPSSCPFNASKDMPVPPSNSPAMGSSSIFRSVDTDVNDDFVNLLQTRLAVTEGSSPSRDPYAAESQQTAITGITEGQLASESDVDILQPLQGRKRKGSRSGVSALGSSANPSLKAKKRIIKHKPRTLSSVAPTASKAKNISPSSLQSHKGVVIGMRGTKGSLIRKTPVKADPEASADELALCTK